MYVTTSGLVLTREFYLENNKLLKIYTKEMGKISAIAVGACKINAKLLSITEPLTETEFTFAVSSLNLKMNRVKIIGGKLIESFTKLKNDINRYLIACKIIETVDLLTFDYVKNEPKYNLILKSLQLVEKSIHIERIYVAFLLRFLKLSGYGLELNRCIKCSSKSEVPFKFSLLNRGILCRKCSEIDRNSKEIDNKTLTFFNSLSKLSGSDIDRLDIPENIEKFIKKECELYLLEYTNKYLNTIQVTTRINDFATNYNRIK